MMMLSDKELRKVKLMLEAGFSKEAAYNYLKKSRTKNAGDENTDMPQYNVFYKILKTELKSEKEIQQVMQVIYDEPFQVASSKLRGDGSAASKKFAEVINSYMDSITSLATSDKLFKLHRKPLKKYNNLLDNEDVKALIKLAKIFGHPFQSSQTFKMLASFYKHVRHMYENMPEDSSFSASSKTKIVGDVPPAKVENTTTLSVAPQATSWGPEEKAITSKIQSLLGMDVDGFYGTKTAKKVSSVFPDIGTIEYPNLNHMRQTALRLAQLRLAQKLQKIVNDGNLADANFNNGNSKKHLDKFLESNQKAKAMIHNSAEASNNLAIVESLLYYANQAPSQQVAKAQQIFDKAKNLLVKDAALLARDISEAKTKKELKPLLVIGSQEFENENLRVLCSKLLGQL